MPTEASVSDRYTRTAIALHWLLGLALLCQIGLGWYLGEVPRGTPARTLWVNSHKSVGITLGLLILFRLYWRLTHAAPPLPASIRRWQQRTARASHIGLYTCMLLMPLTGYLASNFSKFGIKYFNLVALPPWGPDDKQVYTFFNSAHIVLSYLFVALIVIHILAAISHLAHRSDGVFRRMLPYRV
jgi:cytochrome b561